MLHGMKCDDVEAVQTVRLGRKPDASDNSDTHKPETLKLVKVK